MKSLITAIFLTFGAGLASAQHADHDMGMMDRAAPAMTDEASEAPLPTNSYPAVTPEAALLGPEHAADTIFGSPRMAEARAQLRSELGGSPMYGVLADEVEVRVSSGRSGYYWDVQGWFGGDIEKVWIKTEGEGRFGEPTEKVELQTVWSHAMTPWFDLQAGARYDFRPDPERFYFVLGIQGLVPYVFEIDTALFLSEKGKLSARFEGTVDQLITQRLIAQPRLEINLSASDDDQIHVSSGVSSLELGFRLRYEVKREIAPYIGVHWQREFGQGADHLQSLGRNADEAMLVFGIRLFL